jgi:ribosomal-protein-serine acetyltransferase
VRHSKELYELVDRYRDDLRTWLGWVDGQRSPADVERFTRHTLEVFAAGRGVTAGIWTDGRAVGVIGLDARDDRNGEIGYWLVPPARGRGLATRATRALTTYGLRAMGLHRIEICCATGNRASRGIPERLGYTLEGVLRQAEWVNDHYNDLAMYAMLEQEWAAGQEPPAQP